MLKVHDKMSVCYQQYNQEKNRNEKSGFSFHIHGIQDAMIETVSRIFLQRESGQQNSKQEELRSSKKHSEWRRKQRPSGASSSTDLFKEHNTAPAVQRNEGTTMKEGEKPQLS
ncbi:hypothetical protein H5410_032404 [Solanum commersonii]|uniref:Uncharacterized protein n=1 Tax=Solanum commersonii TaxID=4109 RepID=A0A9J5YKX0_SOLCO|nr:hypothetical protein H5410_032404 [Solanum commersonii]